MRRQVVWAVALLVAGATAEADVFYEEEVVNSGVGPQKRGARRTVHKVYIRGQQQRVNTDIETSKEMTAVLQRQGKTLQSTTILRLDQRQVYDIDRSTLTYRQQPLPAARPAAPAPPAGHPVPAAKPAATAAQTPAAAPTPAPAEDPNREIAFRTRVLPDTLRVAGILSRRVAAEMTARHFRPGTKQVTRTNRYLYQAFMAEGFPGYEEIAAFRRLQEAQTTLPPLIRGGLEQLADAVEDPERLERELEALQGFPMQSELKVYTRVGEAEERQVFELSRRVLRISHQPLPDTLFQPSPKLKKLP